MDIKDFQGMDDHQMIMLILYHVVDLKSKSETNEKRLRDLEMDLLQFKTETATRFKTYLAIASSIATALGSILSFFLQKFFH